MSWKTFRAGLVIAAAGAIVATACAPTTTPGATAAGTAAPSVAATAAPTPAVQKGGTLIFGMWQEPTTLAPIYSNQTIAGIVKDFAVESMVRQDNEGNYLPELAKEVPTVQNGGVTVTADGKMTVKWQIKPNVKWSDGKPFTSADLQFTWQAFMKDPKAVSRAGYSDIEKIETPDALTAVITYKTVYAPYPGQFGRGVMPKHLLENEPDFSKTEYNRKPLGTGPFRVTAFKAGDSITLEKNPNYRDAPDKPYLDKIIFKSIPSSEVAIAQLKAGEIHVMWNILESQSPDLEKDPSLSLVVTPSNSVERIEINLAANQDPADPNKPHPVLGDVRVRRALIHATPKQQMVDKLLFGKAKVGSSVSPQGWAADRALTQEAYDPKKANELLDQAGWVRGADGIRTKGGVKASLVIHTTTGNKTREQVQQILVDEWKQIGVELKIQNMPSSVLLSGSWDGKDPRQRGNYDMALYATSAAIDPGEHMIQRYHSSAIPTEQKKSGQNRVRVKDADLDKLITDAGSTLDLEKRKALYKQIFRKINELAPAIWLYDRASIDGHRKTVVGLKGNIWMDIGWDADEWWIRK